MTSHKSAKHWPIDREFSLRGVPCNIGLKLGHVAKGRPEACTREPVARYAMLEVAAEPYLGAQAARRQELAGAPTGTNAGIAGIVRSLREWRLTGAMPCG